MSASFDWSQFPKLDKESATTQPVSPPESNSETAKFDWSQFPSYKESDAPSKLKALKRHALRTGARVVETLGGLPGDIINAPAKLTKYITEKATGKAHPELDEAMKIARFIVPGGNTPTSSELREKGKQLAGDYLEPKTKGEELSDSIVSDFALLALPVKGKIPFIRSLGIALGSNAAEKGAELLGAGENAKTATKIGSVFLLSAFKPNGARKYVDSLFAEAKKTVPKGATIPAQNISKAAKSLETELKKGGSASFKNAALTKAKEIQSKVKKGRIAVDDLTQFKIDINQARSGLYADAALGKGGRKMAKRYLDSAAAVVDEALKEYGQVNPAWEKLYRPANEAYGAIAQSKRVGNAIGRFVKQYPHTTGAALAAELFLAPKTLPAAGVAYGAFKTGELVARIAKSKTLQHYYGEVVKAALKDDAATMTKYLNKLDAGLKKEQTD